MDVRESYLEGPFFGFSVGNLEDLPSPLQALKERVAPCTTMSPQQRLGQLLASAVFNGALLDARWWKRWLEAVMVQAPIHDDLLWIDLEPVVPGGDGPLGQPRRWFADPVSRLLIAHWHNEGVECDTPHPEQCLQAYLGSETPGLTERLIEHSRRHWQLRIPPVLVAHAMGETGAVPVDRDDWRRILGLSTGRPGDPNTFEPERIRAGSRRMPAYLSDVRRIVIEAKRNSRRARPFKILKEKKAAADRLGLHAAKLPVGSFAHQLTHWARYSLLKSRGRDQPGIMPGQVRTHLLNLSCEVFEEGDDPLSWTAEQLFDRYDSRLTRIELESRQHSVYEAIGSFHEYLQNCRPDMPALPAYFFQFRLEGNASANLISPAEYQHALRLCTSIENKICLMLAFRAGLRLNEILGLTVFDFFEGSGSWELVVNHNEFRRLKNRTSRRIVPLTALFAEASCEGGNGKEGSKHELALLLRHVRSRLEVAKATNASGLLIGPIHAKTEAQDTLRKEELEAILFVATRRKTDVHHLRHSFASYLLATMLLPGDVARPAVPRSLSSIISPQRKAQLSERLLGAEKLGQHSVHAVSALLGHIVSGTTLRWYAHLLDLSLMHHVSRPVHEAGLSRHQASVLTGQNKLTAKPVPESLQGKPTSFYRRPKLSPMPLDGTPPTVWQVSQVRGRRARRIERVLRSNEELQVETRAKPKSAAALKVRKAGWREIVAALQPTSSIKEAPQWRTAAHVIRTLSMKSGRPRHGSDPFALEPSSKWVELVDFHWRSDRKLLAIERQALRYVIEHWDPSRDAVRFRSRPLALAWRDLLIDLQFKREEIKLSVTGSGSQRSSSDLHSSLRKDPNVPGTNKTRRRRGSICVSFTGQGSEQSRQLRRAAHFIIVLLAVREGYRGIASQA